MPDRFLGLGQQQVPATERSLNKLSIKAVYDIAKGSNEKWYGFNAVKDMQTFTYSSATIKGTSTTLDSVVSYEQASDWPEVIQKQNTIGGYSWGDDTNLETIFFIKPKNPYEVTQCFVKLGLAMNISAHSSGNFKFDSVDFEVRKFLGTQLKNYAVIAKGNQATGHANLAATGTQIYIFETSFSGESILPSDTLGLYVKMNVTTDTGTRQEILLPFWSYAKTDTTKPWYLSGMMSHELPSFDAAAPAFKHELQGWPIDVFGAAEID